MCRCVVVVELQRGRAGVRVAGKILSVDENDVRVAVVVVIDEGAARPHGLRQPFLSEGAVVVGEVDSGLRGDVAEVNLLSLTDLRRRENHQPQRHRGTEKSSRKFVSSFFSVSLCLCGELHGRSTHYREAPAEDGACCLDERELTFVRCRGRRQRHRNMLMHRLPLVVVFGMNLAVGPGDGLRGLVGFESQVARLVLLG